METGQTIYVVTAGTYSDYHIVGVFSSKKAAACFAKQLQDTHVEEFVVDEKQKWVWHTRYESHIWISTGAIFYSRSEEYLLPPDWNLRSLARKFLGSAETLACGISYESLDHAKKLAAEARQAKLRDPQWCYMEPYQEVERWSRNRKDL